MSQTLLNNLDKVTNKAKAKPNKLFRFTAGWYFVSVNSEIVEIIKLDEGPNIGQWVASEYNKKWYSDPMLTLRELKQSLGV